MLGVLSRVVVRLMAVNLCELSMLLVPGRTVATNWFRCRRNLVILQVVCI